MPTNNVPFMQLPDVALSDGASNTAAGDSRSASTFNGTTWDRWRGNNELSLLASAARTATPAAADQTNYNARGAVITIDVTAAGVTPSVVFTVQGKDATSGQYYTILASAAIVGAGPTVLRVFPGLTAAANTTVSDVLPRTWRINAVHGNATTITYSVGVSMVH